MPSVRVDVQFAARRPWVPSIAQIRTWVSVAIDRAPRRHIPGARRAGAAALVVSVQVVGARAGRELNLRYRGKDKPTNVLSFEGAGRQASGEHNLGDIVICAPVLAREAREQGKAARAHWAHIVVHGTLHLLGFDHLQPAQARAMESLETQIIESMGFSDPYG
jgi:probable rRNA maturation factor